MSSFSDYWKDNIWVQMDGEERDKLEEEEREAQDERNRMWMDEGVAIEGELQKQNKHFGWSRRHFVISKGRNALFIFKNASKVKDLSQVCVAVFCCRLMLCMP
jgi:hypothetical protein